MAINCPYCRHTIRIKQAKPGRHQPNCPKCHRKFLVDVPADPSDPFTVHPLGDAEATPTPTAASSPRREQQTIGGQEPPEIPSTAATAATDTDPTAFWEPVPRPSDAAGALPTGAAINETIDFEGGQMVSTAPGGTAAPPEQPPPKVSQQAPAPSVPSDVPTTLGGYRILKELGRGAMGTVYLARQTSLKREVALKTIRRRAADDPASIARFVREAYAAARLTHPNVVQIYDLGEQQGIYYFSMEYVAGEPLSAVVAREGPLPPERAVGYMVQAARGLKFAHDHGLVHRDVKPANLLVSKDGTVKVADLGLVKTGTAEDSGPDEHLTQAGAIMGTPAYMAPEQADRIAEVDKRADIYSLGCTLFELLTGRPPFRGTGPFDVILKHQTQPIPRPEALVPGIPKKLADIVVKMMAKRPEERYDDLAPVIAELEQCLGTEAPIHYTPAAAHVETLQQCHAQFRGAPAGTLRRGAVIAFWIACALALAVGVVTGAGWLAAGGVALAVLTPLSYFALGGSLERSYLFGKANELVFRATFRDWLAWAAGIVLVLAGLTLARVLWIWGAAWVVGLVLAWLLYFLVDRPLKAQHEAALEPVEQLLKQLRQKGVDESALHRFVAECGGEHWEELFEALFGYEAKVAARKLWGRDARGRTRPGFRAWRDPIIAWIDAQLKAKEALRQRRHLQQSGAEEGEPSGTIAGNLVAELFSQPARFLLGCVLVAACAFWMQQNGLLTTATNVPPAAGSSLPEGYPQPITPLEHWLVRLRLAQPLSTGVFAAGATRWCDSLNVGVAGILLMLSLFVPGLKIAWFLYPAAVVLVAGHTFGIPDPLPLPGIHTTTLAAGLTLAVLGVRYGRDEA